MSQSPLLRMSPFEGYVGEPAFPLPLSIIGMLSRSVLAARAFSSACPSARVNNTANGPDRPWACILVVNAAAACLICVNGVSTPKK
jgi:hypothetical protein